MSAEDDVLAANSAFYAALSSADPERMNAVWLHAEWVTCIHPGGPLLSGWEQVGSSWESILGGDGSLEVRNKPLQSRVQGDIGWVICIEQILQRGGGLASLSAAVATNGFTRTAGAWKIVHHHASPLPVEELEMGTN